MGSNPSQTDEFSQTHHGFSTSVAQGTCQEIYSVQLLSKPRGCRCSTTRQKSLGCNLIYALANSLSQGLTRALDMLLALAMGKSLTPSGIHLDTSAYG